MSLSCRQELLRACIHVQLAFMSSVVGELDFDRSLKVVQRQCGPDTLKSSGKRAFGISKALDRMSHSFFVKCQLSESWLRAEASGNDATMILWAGCRDTVCSAMFEDTVLAHVHRYTPSKQSHSTFSRVKLTTAHSTHFFNTVCSSKPTGGH